MDEIFLEKEINETQLREKLSWERLDHRRASRIALYQESFILDDTNELKLLQEWIVKMIIPFLKYRL